MCTECGTCLSLAGDTIVEFITGYKTEKQHTLHESVI